MGTQIIYLIIHESIKIMRYTIKNLNLEGLCSLLKKTLLMAITWYACEYINYLNIHHGVLRANLKLGGWVL